MYLFAGNKGIDALELIFTLFILVTVTLVVIRLFTQQFTLGQVTSTINSWTEATNYQNTVSQCQALCESYHTNCDTKAAVDFCFAKAQIDINKNGRVGEKKVGGIVQGVPYCEDGIFCFHIYPQCECGQVLSAKNCLKILCDYFQDPDVNGYDPATAIKAIRSEISYGTCDPLTILNKDTGKRADSWWRDAGYDSVSCANIGQKQTTTTPPAVAKFSLSGCTVNSEAQTFSCSATGSCINGAFYIRDSSGNVGQNPQAISGPTFAGPYSSLYTLQKGSCSFQYTCSDAGKEGTATANGCTIN